MEIVNIGWLYSAS